MLDQALIELSLDSLDSFRAEDQRKANYILDQLVCHERDAEDVVHLTESLRRIATRYQIEG